MSDTKKRTVLTPEERVAKIEAELEAARAKMLDKQRKQVTTLLEQRDKLRARSRDIDSKLDTIEFRLSELGYTDTPSAVEEV